MAFFFAAEGAMFSSIAIVESCSAFLSSGPFLSEVDCIIFKILMKSVSYFVEALSLTSVLPFCPRYTCNASLLASSNNCTLALQTGKQLSWFVSYYRYI